MVLNDETFNKVAALFTIPVNSVRYAGAGDGGTYFEVGYKINNNLVSGIHATISQDFKILKLRRIYITWGRNTNNQPTITEQLPFHPSGSIPSIYKIA